METTQKTQSTVKKSVARTPNNAEVFGGIFKFKIEDNDQFGQLEFPVEVEFSAGKETQLPLVYKTVNVTLSRNFKLPLKYTLVGKKEVFSIKLTSVLPIVPEQFRSCARTGMNCNSAPGFSATSIFSNGEEYEAKSVDTVLYITSDGFLSIGMHIPLQDQPTMVSSNNNNLTIVRTLVVKSGIKKTTSQDVQKAEPEPEPEPVQYDTEVFYSSPSAPTFPVVFNIQ